MSKPRVILFKIHVNMYITIRKIGFTYIWKFSGTPISMSYPIFRVYRNKTYLFSTEWSEREHNCDYKRTCLNVYYFCNLRCFSHRTITSSSSRHCLYISAISIQISMIRWYDIVNYVTISGSIHFFFRVLYVIAAEFIQFYYRNTCTMLTPMGTET